MVRLAEEYGYQALLEGRYGELVEGCGCVIEGTFFFSRDIYI